MEICNLFKVLLLLTNNRYARVTLLKDLPEYSSIGTFVWKTYTLFTIFTCIYLGVFSLYTSWKSWTKQHWGNYSGKVSLSFFLFFSCSCPASHFNNVEMICNYALLHIRICLFLLTLKNNSKYFFLEHSNYLIIVLGQKHFWDCERFHVSTLSKSNNVCRKDRLLQNGKILRVASRPNPYLKLPPFAGWCLHFSIFNEPWTKFWVLELYHDSKLPEGRHLGQWRRKKDFL